MAFVFAFGGDVTHTPWFGYPGTYMYTPWGSGFPSGHASSDGGYPVKTYGWGADYISGSGHSQILFSGLQVGGGVIVSSLGGPFEHRIWCDAGTVYYGRNENDNGVNVHWSGGGVEWPGASLPGWIEWATVALEPYMIDAVPLSTPGSIRVRFGGNGNNGGAGMDGWQLAYADNPGMNAAGIVASTGTSDLNLVPGKQYWFRARGHNDVGWSAWSGTISGITKASGGKRRDASSWIDNTIARRLAPGGSWVDLSTKKRWTGASWVDIG